ncbi:ribonucleoside triphosphate reductase [Spirochaeta africana]|uniref:Anaerobic ribonucleoside-triphosphate reductase n=1 Tax=Spirochaeta africana (strain ATCC 700263 / DSM 8902 / Z-7692) TaxID=889378 RepID=H9ULE3_SPIAZ|nr:ribonucleoside triphosphate reductase [Spirochaeta africana]AFG38336.1 anaerobic ribonucleoside-triphosphate reductase [Spirochaeta africana DSM 8902]
MHTKNTTLPQLQVAARNGEQHHFDYTRIAAAVAKACTAAGSETTTDSSLPQQIAREVTGKLFSSGRQVVGVEEIQDLVEAQLVEHRLYEVAKAYMLYRARHEQIRNLQPTMLDIRSTMDGYLGQSDWRVNENANVNYSLGGLILHNSGALTANYWLKHIYSPAIATAHEQADLHIHDLSMFSGYCAGWSLRQLIAEGLGGVPEKISSAPARHLNTLVQQMVNFLGIMQNEWAGAQAFSSFDTYLAPFVKIDSLGLDQVRQALQSFIFGVNTPSRWGSQAPFTNITLDWVVPGDLRDRPAVVGGREQGFTYGDCQAEMDMLNRAFIELMLEGDADGRGFQYPIPTYNITRDFNWEHENAELLFAMTARYGTPYFQNFVNSDLDPGDVRSMCCRLQLDKRELRKRGGGLFGSDELTGSLGVVTINLPRIGYLSRDEQEFFTRLNRLMDLAAESLVIKRRVVNRLMDEGLFPYTRRYLQHLNNHFNTIGLVGMNEAMLNFMGCDMRDPQAQDFAARVLDHMRERLADYQEETGELFNLEATPAESTSYRLARHDRIHYPEIITSGQDEPYYTNSTHLPVGSTEDIFDALDLQDALQTRYTGGTVFHGFIGEAIEDWRACAALVRIIAENYHLPYFTITPTFSICAEHGYLSGEHHECPHCGGPTEIYTRIVGYYRSLRNWNRGKREEFGDRRTYLTEGQGRLPLPGAGTGKAGSEGAGDADIGTPAGIAGGTASGAYARYFYRDGCPNCPAMRTELDGLAASGDISLESVDVDSPAGQELALQHRVLQLPTVQLLDAAGCERLRSSDPREVRQWGAAALR